MEKIRNIIFDFDGTLVDTAPLIIKTMLATMQEMGLPMKSEQECRATIGLRLEEIPATLWPERHDIGAEYARVYRRLFDKLKRPIEVECFPGVIDTLRRLHSMGCNMAIASSRSRRSLVEYVEMFGLADCFSMLVGGDDVKHGKPAPDPVLTILEPMGWKAGETLTVGDASVDIQMGRAAGTKTCGVTYGNGTLAELTAADPDCIIPDFAALLPIVSGVDPAIVSYVEERVIPEYEKFDKAHRSDHARMVIQQSMDLAAHNPGHDINMVYIVAAFHDLGLVNGREMHHVDSRRILEGDRFVGSRFTPEEIAVMEEAIEDHRASGKSRPRNDYGLIVAEADRFIDVETIIRRTVQYGLKNYPELDRQGHYERTVKHLTEKYGPDGYLKIWMPQSDNAARLERLRGIIADRDRLASIFGRIYDEETE